jgi:hypothetical protein
MILYIVYFSSSYCTNIIILKQYTQVLTILRGKPISKDFITKDERVSSWYQLVSMVSKLQHALVIDAAYNVIEENVKCFIQL